MAPIRSLERVSRHRARVRGRDSGRQGITTRLTALACALAAAAVAAPVATAAPLTLDIDQGSYAIRLGDDRSVVVVGDVNGDGVPDTATQGDDPSGNCYPLHVTLRQGPDMSAAGGFDVTDSAGSCPGDAVLAFQAGDVNGDGIADFAVQTRPRAAYRHFGRLYVIFGRRGDASVDLAQLGERGFAIEDSRFTDGSPSDAIQLASGDVTGDGLSDLLIRDGGGQRPPQVVFGKAGGETVDLSKLGSQGFAIEPPPGAGPSDVASVDIASDMNGDGRAEVVMALGNDGNPRKDPNWGTFVVFGRAATDTVTAGRDPAGFRIDETGLAVAVGDVNGDGRGDIALRRSVVFGRADPGFVDPAKKGFGGFAEQGLDQCASEFADDYPKERYVAPAGDVNGDGLADVVFDCEVVFGKRDQNPVDLESPSASGFVVKVGSEPVIGLRGIGDVTGDGRGDLASAGPDASGALIRSPAILTASVPVRLAASGATAPVLCLARAGCVGDVTLLAQEHVACDGAAAAKGGVVGGGGFNLRPDELGRVAITVSDESRRLSRCLLGLGVAERASLASAEPAWTRELPSELLPVPVPAGRPWAARTRPVSRGGGVGGAGFTFLFDGSRRPYALLNMTRGKAARTWLYPPAGRPRLLAFRAASMAPFDRRHVLVAGLRSQHGRLLAQYSLMRGRAGAIKALDPGHTVSDLDVRPVVLAGNGRGLGLAVLRRSGRRGAHIVARYVGRGAGRRMHVVTHAFADLIDAAVDSRGNAVVGWCADPKSGYAVARRRGAFGPTRSMGANLEGQCGDIDVAIGPGGRFTIVWTTQVLPYDPPNGPLEVRVTTGRIGGRARSFTLEDIPDTVSSSAFEVAVAYSGTHPIVGWTSYDAVTDRSRAIAEDLTSHSWRWLSPPEMSAAFADLSAGAGAVAATWGPTADYPTEFATAYASYARHGVDFGPPERVARSGARRSIGPAAVAFAPRSRRPYVGAVNSGHGRASLIVAHR